MNKHVLTLFSFLLSAILGFAQPADATGIQDTLENQIQEVSNVAAPIDLSSDVFQNFTAKGTEGGAQLSWNIDYEALPQLKGQELIIKYNTSVGAKRSKEGYEGSEWLHSDPLPLSTTSFTLKDLAEHEKYEAYIGLAKAGKVIDVVSDKEQMIWSSKTKFKTERSWGIAKLLILIGSLGLFIFGMKIMSDGLQRVSGERLKKMLGSITSNRVKGVITGFGTTAIVQSSSVTTVITVSLVNAGLLTLRQSAGVMMGANIGTTITAWLVLYLGFKVSISSYALILIAFGAPMLFMKFKKSKDLANAIIGFAILFIGLQFLKDAVPNLGRDSALVQFFINYKDIPVLSNVMFVALGALVTIVIQSSSAAMALTLTMVSKGIIPFEVACAMVLGENIGTTITAELASMVGNVHAKRSARIHSMFNIVGVTWMLIVMVPFLSMLGWIVGGIHDVQFDPLNPELANEGIAWFHTTFNLANVLLLIWFVPLLVRLAERTVKSRGESDEEFKLDYINAGGAVDFPEVAVMEATKEVAKFGGIAARMPKFVHTLLNDSDQKVRNKMFSKIHKYEDITDRVEIEVAQFLDEVSRSQLSPETSSQIRSLLSITNDLERIGDIFYQMSKTIEQKDESNYYFMPEQRENINSMLALIGKAFEEMNHNLNSEYGHISLDKARSYETQINQLRNSLRRTHISNVEKGEYNIHAGMLYNDLFSLCEKAGDHIINVSEAVAGEI